jgi:hypothetical protein
MPLTMRPTGLGSGIDQTARTTPSVTGESEVGRIYQSRGCPNSLRWFWSLTVNGPMTRSDRVATRRKLTVSEELGRVEAWAKLEGVL